MKAKEAHKLLSQYSGEELYRKAQELFRSEVNILIKLRHHSKTPTPQALEGILDQVSSWFEKISPGLAWGSEDAPKNIVSWERGEIFASLKLLDPKLAKWGDRTRKEIRKGTPIPILAAMSNGDLEAASSFMLGQIKIQAQQWSELREKRKNFLATLGKKPCLYGAEAKECTFQESFSMVGLLPTSTSDVAFACSRTDEKCEFQLEEVKKSG